MKIIKLSLCISMVGAFATLPPAYANEVVTNCTQVTDMGGSDSNTNNNESCAAVTIPFDLGDAPDPSFPVLLANDGARHQLGTDVYLGKCVDGDSGNVQGDASVDDATEGQPVYGVCETDKFGKLDDEDGVALAELHVGDTQNTLQVTASSACKLNAWVDWNQDGSWGGTGEQVFIDQVLAAGRNDLTMDVPAFAAEGTIYTRFRCSTAGGDGIGGEAADGEVEDYVLNVLPAIPKTPVSVGDTIWEDTDKDGKQTAGENPLAGATVSLLDSKGAPAKDLTGTIVADVTTDATGKYVFGNLPEGDYSVKVTPPTDYIVSPSAGDVDDVPANDDSNCAVQGDGSITTALFSLSAGGEPIDDGDTDANSNLSVDCGFYKPTESVHSLGNKVWVDDGAGTAANANNGTLDAGEAAVADGVVVELRDAAGALLTSTTTSKGFYLFSGLTAGDYKVCVAASNFADTAILKGFSASTSGNEADANAGVDSNDNGSDVLADGLCSNVITLDANAPTGETDTASGTAGDDGMNTPDALSDLTVDFAVIPPTPPTPMSVGDTVWIDADENGLQGKDELPLVGVVVTLLDKDGNPVKDLAGNTVDYMQTDASGKYLFSNLPEGEYIVRVQAPDGYAVTQGGAAVDTDPSNTDSNCAVTGGNVQTLPFLLSAGAESITDGDTDANTDLSVDCGFYVPKVPTHSLGNRVWVDANNNGAADVGETPAVAGIALELKDVNGAVLTATTTDVEGRYLFSNLSAGSYQVCVVADNFVAGNILEGFTASTGSSQAADANTDIDGDDNGSDDIATGLCSNLIVLDDKELTGEAGINDQPGVDGVGTDDNRSNLSVDFGIVPPVVPPKLVAVGDYLWIDADKNGKQDSSEQPLAGAIVTLLDKDGNPATDQDGNAIAPVTTGADGLYGFTKLPEGDYSIRVQAPEGYLPTTNAGDADDVVANDDSNCAVMGDNVQSAPFTLMAGTEPASALDGDGDTSNLTVDCGFYQPTTAVHSIGNMVWVDNGAGDATKAANGQFDEGEGLLNGIKLELRDTTGAVIDSTMTAGGYYLFPGLNAGEYQVCVAAANFTGMGKLVGHTAGVNGKEADANANGDSNDNSGTMTANGLCSNIIVLDDQEPTGELPTGVGIAGDDGMGTDDNRSNLTVDFAVLPPAVAPTPVAVGDRIWIDTNENGQQDPDEPGLANATVTLLDKSGNPVNDLDGKPVAALTTAADGLYLFENLPQGEYVVRIAAPAGYITTQGGAAVNDDPSNTDSNCQVVDGQTQTGAFNLTTDNLTVDCGFYQPKVPTHSLGNRVWIDTNNNGMADNDELPASAGVGLELKDASGAVIKATTTDATGRYLFSGLAAGDYQVCIVADNFAAGNLLEGYTASTGGTIADANTNIDGDDNGSDDIKAGLCSNLVVLDDQEPTGEITATGADGVDGMGTDDNRSNLTVDFGIVPPVVPPKLVAVGDYLWIDADKNGKQDSGEQPLAGAVVTLLDKDGNPATDQDGNAIAPVTTGADGLYGFTKLPEGDYSIRVQAPEGYLPTTNAGDADDVVANDDSNCAVMGDNVQSAPFTLMAGTEPASALDGDGDTSNLTVDCGFYQPTTAVHSIGNMVWVDNGAGDATKAANGQFDEGEGLLNGIKLELRDTTGAVIDSTMTAGGYYVFTGLNAGDYQVCVAAANFTGMGKLVGHTAGVNGKEADANTNGDSNDNSGTMTANGLCSNVIVLDDQEPTGELPTGVGIAGDDGMGTDDNRSNLTVDFAVLPPAVAPTPVTVGDRIWIDTDEDGQQDENEIGLENATVTLLDKSGNPVNDLDGKPVAALTTAADGLYLFENLPQGEYVVRVAAPAGYITTQGGAAVNDDPSNTDSNCQVVDGQTQTGAFNLTTDNLTVDCGFYQPKVPTHSLGNRVWIDTNNNGMADNDELPASAGVGLELKDASGAVIKATTTDATGRYLFSGLAAGDYQVCVVADNFATGKLLEGYTASTGGTIADANTNVDGDDNGSDDIKAGLCSNLVVLDDQEPTGEITATGADGVDGMGTDDNRSNLTVDFGIVPPAVPPQVVSVGDKIWLDANENGQQDENESGLENATVTLLDKSGNPVNDLDGKPVAAVTTAADGLYLFENLPAGEYLIRVVAPDGYINTQGGAAVNDDPSNIDSNCQAVDGQTQTGVFNLTTDNLTVDCGFYVPKVPMHSVGNTVWVDANNNGLFDKDEQPVVDGVVMELLDKNGAVMAYTETKDGYYLFSGLETGEYSVCVAHGNFDQGVLKGYTASTMGDEADVNAGTDNADNGDNDTQDGLCSEMIILDDQSPTGELPTASGKAGDDGMSTDDNRSNLTIDFGVVAPAKTVSVGDYIWVDVNENGQQDAGDTPLAGATVTLLDKDGNAVVLGGDMVIAPIITGADGKYVFSNLPEGQYSISVAAPADSDYMPTKGGADVDNDASNTDSNCDVDTGKTSLFTLTAGAEPDAAADGDGTDSNMTVDCGFYLPAAEKATISGTVSVDTTGDSSGETPLAGITLSLLKPDGTPVLDTDGKPVTTLTNANGEYLFANLDAGDYLVVQTQPADYNSVTDGDTTSPEDDATNTDTTDDRIPVTVIAGETDDRNDFVERAPVKPNTVSVGDFIWIDANENGQQDKDDIGLAGATVTLMNKDGNPVVLDGTAVAPIVTAADGKYVFGNLPEGEYSIRVTAPQGSAYLPTQGGAKVDNDASNTDSNCSVDTGKTSLFTLTAGNEPDVAADGDSTDGNMTVDCGFYLPKKPLHSIGNTVWVDNGEGSAANNGQFDQGETLPSGVQVELRDAAGALIRSTQTDKGFYLFSELEAGEYKVCVAGSNFNDGAALDGFTASTAEKEADANANGDNNDNGDSTASDGLCSNLIVLDDKEPKGEQPTASGIAGNDGMKTDDNRSNLTVDFAVVPVQTVTPGTPVAVGNQIWVDSNANGVREANEGFLENAVVTLTDASGRAVADLDGNTVAPHTTGADGLYLFDNLPEGEYIVTVEPPAGFSPTIGGIDADDDANDMDSNCRVNPINTTIETHPFKLTAGAEPDADGDDANGNMTIDCGFYSGMSLGDKVWLDNNANGQQDNAEPGIRGVSVSLLEADGITPATDIDGKPVAAVLTDDNGNYLFQNLKPGNYIVVMSPAANSGYSATKGGVDPDADPSNTDSNCKAVDGRFQTPTFSLMPSVTSDGNSFSNVSVDCGLFRPLNLGSRLWLDLNNDGKQDGGEPGIPGATVTLLTVDGKPVSNIFGDVLQPQTTDGDGKYFFGNLREGDYIVKVIPPAGYTATVPNADPNDDNPTDSNGIPASDGSISSGVIRLTPGAEPEDGGMTNTTIGFGLVANLSVAVPTLSQWGVAIMSMLLATAAFFRRRRED
ncbi:MAG: IPTL-CTERM sorting domain-containing protein [Candidatus Thiothrix sulfatifontis]|nr:MAG: IPTL-CTERM sorting domain-containing protein [Candidatus Thiothrix sulfatifontis]